MKLVVEKDANRNCFPTDNGMDTIIKKFKIVPLCSLAIFGVFKGKWDGSNQDSSIITIKNFKDYSYTDSCTYGLYRYTNLTGINDTFVGGGIPTSNTELIRTESSFGNLGVSHFKIDPHTNQIVFKYTYASKPYIFRGRKISN
ncbi:hypothetical protein QQ054_13045 [Oscillatoria amoena NRMC-F 0135]|nr:hypothetical protein [Oscillatoria amoena NRMC-F 0135]